LDEAGCIYNVHLSNRAKKEHVKIINLLLIQIGKGWEGESDDNDDDNNDDEDDDGDNNGEYVEFHYVAITNLALFLAQKTNYGSNLPLQTCPLCMSAFRKKESLKNHMLMCGTKDPQRVICPDPPKKEDNMEEGEEDEWSENPMEFKDFGKTQSHPLFGVSDFEAKAMCGSGADQFNSNNSRIIHTQEPVSYSLYIYDIYGKIIFKRTKVCEEGVMKDYYATLLKLGKKLESILAHETPCTLSKPDQQLKIQEAEVCYVCKEPFIQNNLCMQKTLDHSHYSGEMRGIAHSKCNLTMRRQKKIPIFLHGFSNYDSHFFIKSLESVKNPSQFKIKGLPYNSERFRTLEILNFLFLDSCAFFSGSLSNMVEELVKSDHKFPLLNQSGLFKTEEQRMLLLRKGVFPYELLTSVKLFSQLKKFPHISNFHSSLTNSSISENDYQHGKKVFEVFQCKNMVDYLILYQKLDAILLAEIVEKFRKFTKINFGLCMLQFISLPSLAWSAMMYKTKVKIDLLTEIDQILFFENAIRGGVSYCATRYGESVENKSIIYIDCSNLYGWCQKQFLPQSDFSWMKKEEITNFNINQQKLDQEWGYVLEVDLDYPAELHKLHESYPLAAESMEITEEMLSPYAKKEYAKITGKIPPQNGEKCNFKYKSQKLSGNLLPKRNFVCHYATLAFYLKSGMKLVKIHRGMKFKQAPYMSDYIDLCTNLRINSKTSFEKRLCKLFSNANYGKSLQNTRKYMDARITTRKKHFSRIIQHPLFSNYKIISENVAICFLRKASVRLNRCYSAGFSILEYSKLFMGKMYYEKILPAFDNSPEKCEVLMSDTDSFILQVEGENTNEIFSKFSDIMDFSNYDVRSSLHNPSRKNIPGFF
jgi:hypothetical protein